MFKKLIVPLDGSKTAEVALPHAVRMAQLLDAQLLLVQVIEMPPFLEGTLNVEEALLESTENYLQEIRATITNPDLALHLPVDRVKICVSYGNISYEIGRIAISQEAELIIMTTSGRNSLTRLLLGSVAANVIQHTPVPVLMLKPSREQCSFKTREALLDSAESSGEKMGRYRIVVTVDQQEEVKFVLEPAMELARELNATIHLLHVVRPYIPIDTIESWTEEHLDLTPERLNTEAHQYLLDDADAQLAKLQAEVEEQGLKCVRAVREGEPSVEIETYARAIQARMLVMATHARGTLGKVFLGSVSEEVLRHTNLPVLLVRLQHSSSHVTGSSNKSQKGAKEIPAKV